MDLNKDSSKETLKPEILHLSKADQEKFVEALLNPPPLTDAMKKALELRERLIQP
jgi:uncharacterized protein (DUF1778 family)